MPAFKTAYLIHGDDHGRIGERRHRLRELAEKESGVNGVELFEGEASAPEAVANALLAMTFAIGRRFVIVDGVERWKDSEVADTVAPALAAMGDDTTVAFFAREDGRMKAPAKLADAVKKAGGDIAAEMALKAKDLPRWLMGEATKLGIELDGAGAQALVAHVGERQQRLLREIEKLALEHGQGARIGVSEVEEVAADSAERQVWGFVDALVTRDTRTATRRFLELRAQGEAMPRLIPSMARRLREVLSVAERLREGESPAQVKATTKGAPWQVDKRIKEARNADADVLRAALVALADLELDTRGGSELDDDTVGLRAIAAMTA
ncbi:MAG: DNA polymerase III subunit delta [Solirubrobacteraceae bacterium]